MKLNFIIIKYYYNIMDSASILVPSSFFLILWLKFKKKTKFSLEYTKNQLMKIMDLFDGYTKIFIFQLQN